MIGLGIDLGRDTLKIAVAYGEKGQETIKKIDSGSKFKKHIPALAYYDTATQEWLYGTHINSVGTDRPFEYIVRIKDLISLCDHDKSMYNQGHIFPRFRFSTIKDKKDTRTAYERIKARDYCFEAGNATPKTVCEGYFRYVKEIVDSRCDDQDRKVALIYSSAAKTEYIKEYQRLAKESFRDVEVRRMTAAKAVSKYAEHRGYLDAGGGALLIFDMGEESISVLKARLKDGTLTVDGASGHREPMPIGGKNIDKDIADAIERKIEDREIPGCTSDADRKEFGTGLQSMQYLFMQEVKSAKSYLSAAEDPDTAVRVALYRDVCVVTDITRAEVIEATRGTAKAIAKYIREELTNQVNTDVKNVLLCGGIIKTPGLTDAIEKALGRKDKDKLLFFDCEEKRGDQITVEKNEVSLYGAAMGGALLASRDFDGQAETVLTLSYGTWVIKKGEKKKVFCGFAQKGEKLKQDAYTEFWTSSIPTCAKADNEEIYSVANMPADDDMFEVGEIGSDIRLKAQKSYGLSTVAGGKEGSLKIILEYLDDGSKLEIKDITNGEMIFQEGIVVDPEGIAKPQIKSGKEIRIKDWYDFSARYNPDPTDEKKFKKIKLAIIDSAGMKKEREQVDDNTYWTYYKLNDNARDKAIQFLDSKTMRKVILYLKMDGLEDIDVTAVV